MRTIVKETLLDELRGVEAGLSPENLHRDGEATRADVERRRKTLMARRADLIKRLGYEPTYEELYRGL